MTFADTPDFQRSVATSGSRLATVSGALSAATVTLTANCESIVIGCGAGGNLEVTSVVGITTGIRYPFMPVAGLLAGTNAEQWYASVAPALDNQVEVNLAAAPGLSWYVGADQGVRVVGDSVLEQLTQLNGAAGAKQGILVFGTDTVDMWALRTDTTGRLAIGDPNIPAGVIPQRPTLSTGLLTVANGGQILAAPSSGAYYIWGIDVNTGAADNMDLQSSAGLQICQMSSDEVTGVGSNFMGFRDLFGQRWAANLTYHAYTVNQSAIFVIRYALGP